MFHRTFLFKINQKVILYNKKFSSEYSSVSKENATKFVELRLQFSSNFVTFYAFDIDVVLLDAVPQAALINSQQFGGPHLNTPGFTQGFDDHAFFDFPQALIQGDVGR